MHVVRPSSPTSTPESRSTAVARSSDRGGAVRSLTAVGPQITPSKSGRPAASRGHSSPVAASSSFVTAGESRSQPGQEMTTTSPLSNAATNRS